MTSPNGATRMGATSMAAAKRQPSGTAAHICNRSGGKGSRGAQMA